ncbi:RNA polymerase III transcription factor IIIC subunit-domain-containing protein [Circinella umbellata]|nr:RNA polymerase III transcription factor IIIC subunit-domain-containing protein [Circinella umbellata]
MDQSFKLNVPNRKFVLVEYPGRVKNVDRALNTLGGEKTVANLLDNDVKTIELRQRPKDPFCHPIAGDVLHTSGLLLKVTKRKKKNQPDEEATFKTEALGTISKTCRFRDFQYSVSKDNKYRQLRDSLENGKVNDIINFKFNEENENLIQIPPPVISMRETPFDYSYKQNQPVMRVRVRQRDGSYAVKLVHRFRRPALEIASIKFEDKAPTGPAFDVSLLKPEEEALAKDLQKLFEEKPIRTRVGILNHVTAYNQRYLRGALNTVAYTFRTGPWRECWVKFGIDPRTDKKYYIYQHISVRGLFDWLESRPIAGKRKPVSRNAKQQALQKKDVTINSLEEPVNIIFDGKNAPPKNAVICLCDITDPDFQTFLKTSKYLKSTCTRQAGFYYSCVFERMRNLLKKKMLEWKSSGKMSSSTNVTQGLDQAIAKEIKEKQYGESSDLVDRGGDLKDNDQEKESQQEHHNDRGSSNISSSSSSSRRRNTDSHDEDEIMDMDQDNKYSNVDENTHSKEKAFAEALRQFQGFNFGSVGINELEEFDYDDIIGEDIVEPEDVEGEEVVEQDEDDEEEEQDEDDEEEEQEDKPLWALDDDLGL